MQSNYIAVNEILWLLPGFDQWEQVLQVADPAIRKMSKPCYLINDYCINTL